MSGTATVTVTPVPVAAVTVSPGSASVVMGATVQLTATPRDSSGNALTGRTVTWASDITTVAAVDGNGIVTAGSATITATSEGQSGSAAIPVTAPPPPDAPVVFVGAGDIGSCSTNRDEPTAQN